MNNNKLIEQASNGKVRFSQVIILVQNKQADDLSCRFSENVFYSFLA